MSDLDPEAELGLQAFGDMARAMDRLGHTLEAVDHRQQIRLADEAHDASEAHQAAFKAIEAANMARDAAQSALQAAKTEMRSSLLWSGLTVLSVVLGAFAGGFWVGNRDGWSQGQQDGYQHARNQVDAADWANTPNGQRAWNLDQDGTLNRLVTCAGPGWKVENQDGKRVCFPYPDQQGRQNGWFLP